MNVSPQNSSRDVTLIINNTNSTHNKRSPRYFKTEIVGNMKKFKKSIEISTKNISDVLQVPIVTSLYKTKNFKNPCLEGRSVPYDTIALMYVHIEGFDSDFCINQGNMLALDICDTWYAFSKAGWDKHKNDEV
jgi:hypothetical protein